MNGGGEPIAVGPEVLERALCDAVDIGRIDQGAPRRATKSVAPAIRRLVWHRDRGRCIVPGCRSTIHSEVHHIRFRSRRGSHDPSNLAVLCAACHARVHEGTLVIRGQAPDRLTFAFPNRRDVAGDAISALTNLGFTKADARRAVDSVCAHVGASPAFEDLVRAALRELG